MRNVTYKDLPDLACHSDKGNTENCSSNIPFSKASNKKDTKTSSKHIKVSRIDHYSSKHGGTSKSKISKSGRLGSRGKCMWHLLKPPVCQVALFDQVQLSPLNTDACYISHLYSSFSPLILQVWILPAYSPLHPISVIPRKKSTKKTQDSNLLAQLSSSQSST